MTDWVTLRDQLNLTLKPIDDWPGKPTPSWQRDRGPFTAAIKDTLQILRRELNALRAKAIVLQIAIKPHQLRLDGLPRAGATAEHPGVILAFESIQGPLRIWFDKFTHWDKNLRAIALHLEHLRMAGLYGVGEDGQQYRGWTAIPAVHKEPDFPTDILDVASLVFSWSDRSFGSLDVDEVVRNSEAARKLIREVQVKNHPDNGGNADLFVRAQRAIDALKKHHGL